MAELRKMPGMRERRRGVWELIVEAGRDPLTGKNRQISRTFEGSLRDAKKARAELLTEVGRGLHVGTNGTLDDLFDAWVPELERKKRSPNTVHGYAKEYRNNIQPTLGRTMVRKISTRMLSELYGAHEQRGLAPSSIRKIHATISSMMTQACRWGWRSDNPAVWAEPPPVPTKPRIVPTPDEVRQLIEAAARSRRPEYGRLFFVAATTGARRGELCALRRQRDLDGEEQVAVIARNLIELSHRPLEEAPTKNRRERSLAIDDRTMEVLAAQIEMMEKRASLLGTELVADAFIFSDSPDGSKPWRPSAVTRYFGRLRTREGLDHLTFRTLRRFMDTYGQQLGFAPAQVALRAGHDPSIALRYYTGNVDEADKLLADAIANLISPLANPR